MKAFKKAFDYRNRKKSVRDVKGAEEPAACDDVKVSKMSLKEGSMQALKAQDLQGKEEQLDAVVADSSSEERNQPTDEENFSEP